MAIVVSNKSISETLDERMKASKDYNENKRKRTFGNVSVTFATEEAARDFDEYLESTFTLYVDGEAVDSYKVKERFDPYTFFGIKKGEDDDND